MQLSRRYALGCTWPLVVVMAIELAITLMLPARYTFAPAWGIAVLLAVALAIAMSAFVAEYQERPRAALLVSGILILMLTVVLVALLANLVVLLVSGGKDVRGWPLLSSGVQVWISNVLVFGLWFWLLDRGGPHARITRGEGAQEFLFPEMTTLRPGDPPWAPNVVEYMYLSFTNCTAFSPTDTLPLSSRMRVLMAVQALISLVTIAVVAARAVNIMA